MLGRPQHLPLRFIPKLNSAGRAPFVMYVKRRALGGSEAVAWGFINSEGHYVNTNINNKCVARQNCTWFVGGDEFQELPSLLQETVFQSAVTVHVEFETLHTREHKNDMSARGKFHFFSSFTLSVLFGFSSYLPLEHLRTQKKWHHSSNRRILWFKGCSFIAQES